MGRTRNHRSRTTKNKQYKKSHDTKRRAKDIDQIQEELEKVQQGQTQPISFDFDDDLPGGGQFFCITCARHFADTSTLEKHNETKPHRRRLKDIAQKRYTHEEAEIAAGKSVEKYVPVRRVCEQQIEQMDNE